jgi:pyruvate,water dikinase
MAPMHKAGGRLFVDVTQNLASPDSRKMLLSAMGQHDPLIKDALMAIVERNDFIKLSKNDLKEQSTGTRSKDIYPPGSQIQLDSDPTIVSDLIKNNQTSVEELKRNIQARSGLGLLDFILEDIQELKKILWDPRSSAV